MFLLSSHREQTTFVYTVDRCVCCWTLPDRIYYPKRKNLRPITAHMRIARALRFMHGKPIYLHVFTPKRLKRWSRENREKKVWTPTNILILSPRWADSLTHLPSIRERCMIHAAALFCFQASNTVAGPQKEFSRLAVVTWDCMQTFIIIIRAIAHRIFGMEMKANIQRLGGVYTVRCCWVNVWLTLARLNPHFTCQHRHSMNTRWTQSAHNKKMLMVAV